MIYHGRADSIRLDCDDHGWTLTVDTDQGDSLVLNIQAAAFKFADSKGFRELAAWRDSGYKAMSEHLQGRATGVLDDAD